MASNEMVEIGWATLRAFIADNRLPAPMITLLDDRAHDTGKFRVEVRDERQLALWVLAAGGDARWYTAEGKQWRELSTVLGGFPVQVVTDHIPAVKT